MKCSKCDKELQNDEKVCPECGAEVLKNDKKVSERKFIVNNNFDLGAVLASCLQFILGVVLKPVSSFKQKLKEFSDVKTVGVLVLLVSLARMILNLLSAVVSSIFFREVNFWTGKSKLIVSFDRLKNLDYIDLIFKQFFGFIIIVLAIALVYYVVALIMKKNVNYFKLVAITTVSFVSFVVTSSIIYTIISYIYVPIGIFLIVAAFVYSLITFITAIDEEMSFKDSNFKIYFHAICITVIFIASYYVLGSSFSSVGAITSLLK